MKAGTNIQYYLITDDRFESEILCKMNDLINKLCDNIEGKATVKNLHAIKPELLTWPDGSQQYRLYCTLETIKPMTRDEIYIMTNSIQAHPLKFVKPIRLN